MIVAGGKHETDEQRNSVRIDDCTMTTERWLNRADEGWTLWSSFQFDMFMAEFDFVQKDPVQHYIYAGEKSGDDPNGLVLVGFKMRGEATARFEKSVHRPPKNETRPSPRGDGTSHYFEDTNSFFFSMQGSGVEAKANLFTQSFARYVASYCTPIG